MSPRALLWLGLAGLGYVLFPFDLIPDVPGIGWIDDIVVVLAIWWTISAARRRNAEGRIPPGAAADALPAEDPPGTAFQQRFQSPEAHVVLGVPRTADAAEVKQAYRALLTQYHPDKVSHLSPEFQALAHDRVVAIQDAYTRMGGP